MATPSTPHSTTAVPLPVVTDLTICIFSPTGPPSTPVPNPQIWHRIEKELCLHESRQTAWLYVAVKNEEDLEVEDLLVTDISVGESPPNASSGHAWDSRPGGIWVLRNKFSGSIDQAVTEVDVLFGEDAVDPRPERALMQEPLQLDAEPHIPVARLSVLCGRVKPRPGAGAELRVGANGKFRIVQMSDTHMGTGPGVCKDAIDAHGKHLPECEADPRTMKFMRTVLDIEDPDLAILAGDLAHHGIFDTQTALFKVVAPIIEREIPFAAVFGNHDSEGTHALSRTAQMSILQNLPFSLCEPGPEEVDGIGNFYLRVLAPAPSQRPLSTLYFLDSHGQIPSWIRNPDYEPIKQSQIDWFVEVSQAQRRERQKDNNDDRFHLSLAFQHIPLPEFGDHKLSIRKGHRRERTEGPSCHTDFYDALVKERISAFSCGHDHVNDFCALLPHQTQQLGNKISEPGPWLCYGGGTGFRGYCSFGGKRYHRRVRVWEFDAYTGNLETWMRVEYAQDKVDRILLVRGGVVNDSPGKEDGGSGCVVS